MAPKFVAVHPNPREEDSMVAETGETLVEAVQKLKDFLEDTLQTFYVEDVKVYSIHESFSVEAKLGFVCKKES